MTLGVARRALTAAALLLGGAAAPLWGQVVDTVDRVVAIVGYTPILASEVDEELFARFPDGKNLPPEGPDRRELRRQIIQELVDIELLYQAALRDTAVKVTDEQVNAAVDQQLRNVRQKFPSDAAFRAEIAKTGFQTADEYRAWLTERQRREIIRNRYIESLRGGGALKPVIPTERELRAAFEQRRGGQQRPEVVSFRQVVVAPIPTPEARQRARALADSIVRELRRGADFAVAARRFSQDPGSRDQGGSLGWFRRGVMHKNFEDAAFGLRPGVISDPVETPFGLHILQVERVQPAEVSARHILLMPDLQPEAGDSALALATRVREALGAGASIDSLQRLYHDPMEERDIRDFPADRLLPAYQAPLAGVGRGEVSAVFRLETPADPARAKYAVVLVTDRKAAGEYEYDEVKDVLRSQLGEQLAVRRFLDRLRAASYVEVREP